MVCCRDEQLIWSGMMVVRVVIIVIMNMLVVRRESVEVLYNI